MDERKTKHHLIAVIHTYKSVIVMIYAPMLLMIPIALFLPENVLASNSWLLSLTSYIGQHIPMIARLSEPTDFPQVAKFFYSFLFLLAPLWLYGLFLLPDDKFIPLKYHIKHKVRIPLLSFLFIIMFVYVEIIPHATSPGLGWVMSLSKHSRLGLGVCGTLLIEGMLVVIYAIFLWIKRIPQIYKFRN